MVYDERSNFVGDSHWREDSELNEGEELELERGGILVEVGECIGTRDQDLSELVDKRVREREERAAAKAAGPRASLPRPQTSTPAAAQHLRPKPLNAVIGIPTGHYGRAMVSTLSPFEQKHSNNQTDEGNGRSTKRQKRNDTPTKSGYAQNLLGATLNLGSSRPANTQPIRYEPLKASICPQAETIDLTRDENGDGIDVGATRVQQNLSKTPAKAQKRKAPLSKSGYASNLTGATLALSGLKAFPAAKPERCQNMSTAAPASPNHEDHSATSGYQEYMTSCPAVNLKPKPKPKPTKGAETPGHGSSSSAFAQEPPLSKSVQQSSLSHKNKSPQDPTAASLIDEQPITTLRIKPRPPRQMMMLMELSSRQKRHWGVQVADEPSAGSTVNRVPRTIIATGSNSIHSARCGSDTDIHVPLDSSTITAIASSSETQKTDHDNHGNLDGPSDAQLQTAMLETRMLVGGSIRKIGQNITPFATGSPRIELDQPENTALLLGSELLPQRERANNGNETFDNCIPKPRVTVGRSKLLNTDIPKARRKLTSGHGSFEGTEVLMTTGLELGLAEKEGVISTVTSLRKPADVPQSFETRLVPEIGHGRQSLDTSVRLEGKCPPHARSVTENGQPEPPRSRSFTSGMNATTTPDIVIKPSPASFFAVTIVDRLNYPVQTAENAECPATSSTTRLVHPAALRSSAKAIAGNMVNAGVPASNALAGKAPPRPGMSVRAEITTIKGDPGAGPPVRESMSRGPWSRESFDLFGTWRPPGRAAYSNS